MLYLNKLYLSLSSLFIIIHIILILLSLLLYEYIIGAVLPIGEVSGIAYQRIRCISKDALKGLPHHTNFDVVRSVVAYFGFSSILLNYFYDYFHIKYNNNENEYLSETEQDEEDLFFHHHEE